MFASKTTNSGSTWIRHNLAAVGHTYAIAVDPTNSNIVYAGGNPGIFKTTNFGVSWTDVSTGLTDYIMTITINPVAPNILYAGTRDGVFKSTNSGTSWSNIGLAEVNAILLDPNGPDTVYVGTNSGVYISISGGISWQAMNSGLEDTNVTCLCIDPGNYLYATTYGSGMYKWSLEPGISEDNSTKQDKTILFAHANPIKGEMKIKFQIIETSEVDLIVHDVKGAIVKELLRTIKSPGTYTQIWNGNDEKGLPVPAGVYFYRLSANDKHYTKKIIWLK